MHVLCFTVVVKTIGLSPAPVPPQAPPRPALPIPRAERDGFRHWSLAAILINAALYSCWSLWPFKTAVIYSTL